MRKALLVIDIPNETVEDWYADCRIFENKGMHRMFNRIVNLKPMPKKIDANDWNRMFSGTYQERNAKGYGYNACIDEILGENDWRKEND